MLLFSGALFIMMAGTIRAVVILTVSAIQYRACRQSLGPRLHHVLISHPSFRRALMVLFLEAPGLVVKPLWLLSSRIFRLSSL